MNLMPGLWLILNGSILPTPRKKHIAYIVRLYTFFAPLLPPAPARRPGDVSEMTSVDAKTICHATEMIPGHSGTTSVASETTGDASETGSDTSGMILDASEVIFDASEMTLDASETVSVTSEMIFVTSEIISGVIIGPVLAAKSVGTGSKRGI